jgi:phosphoribosyl-ATP pyrophosphohydrolase
MSDVEADVKAFFDKFGVPRKQWPEWPSEHVLNFRLAHLSEEFTELMVARVKNDLPTFADSLIDLVYLAVGTALACGIPFDQVWDEVQAANMRQVRAQRADDSKRGSSYDVVKPEGWVGPDVEGVLRRNGH